MYKLLVCVVVSLCVTSAYGQQYVAAPQQLVPVQQPLVPVPQSAWQQPNQTWQPNWLPAAPVVSAPVQDGWRPSLPDKGVDLNRARQPDVFHYHLHEIQPQQQRSNGYYYYPNTGCYQRDYYVPRCQYWWPW